MSNKNNKKLIARISAFLQHELRNIGLGKLSIQPACSYNMLLLWIASIFTSIRVINLAPVPVPVSGFCLFLFRWVGVHSCFQKGLHLHKF